MQSSPQKNGTLNFVLSRRKIVVVGAERCGKTSLILRHLGRAMPMGDQRVPASEYDGVIDIPGKPVVRIMFWDVPMQDQHAERRKESYANANVVFLCYAIDDPDSLEQAISRWLTEVKDSLHCPIILVGLKKDLRSPTGNTTLDNRPAISHMIGFGASTTYNLRHFVECSALTGIGMFDLFSYTRDLLNPNQNV